MKKLLTLTTSLILVGTLANAATTDDVIADLQAQGFTNNIEVRVNGSQIKASGSNGTETIHAIYSADGTLISSDTGSSNDGTSTSNGTSHGDDDGDSDHNGSDNDHSGGSDDHGGGSDDHSGGSDDHGGGSDDHGGSSDGGGDHDGGSDDN
jgi:hypothetical protein